MLKEKAIGFGGAIVLGILLMALFPQAISVADPNRIDVSVLLSGPSLAHPLGTDELGRDIWSRVVVGARVSLIVALAAIGSALVAGSMIGVFAAWAGGRVDNFIMRLMDLAFAFRERDVRDHAVESPLRVFAGEQSGHHLGKRERELQSGLHTLIALALQRHRRIDRLKRLRETGDILSEAIDDFLTSPAEGAHRRFVVEDQYNPE